MKEEIVYYPESKDPSLQVSFHFSKLFFANLLMLLFTGYSNR